MTVVLCFMAFPILPIVLGLRWWLAAGRYTAIKERVTQYRRPTIDDVIGHGILGTYQALATAKSISDAEVEAGAGGDEAQRLRVTASRRWRQYIVSMPIGVFLALGLAELIPAVSTSTRRGTDEIALLVVLLGVFLLIAAVQVRNVLSLVRTGRSRGMVLAYVAGLLGLLIGGVISIIAVFAPS